ncbi:mogroside I-E synthase-like [Silene latifolia]|uniref:mogroside I-E synthase-like n=1 Tax=Silene latifolia TaxID=37657 RepID=UPI003D77C814
MESQPQELNEIHVIVIPYPIQGHINPMLQFSKQLASRGLKVTLATTPAFSSKFVHSEQSNSISIETISDGSTLTETANTKNVDAYIKRFDLIAPRSLTQLIETKIQLGHNIKCIIYDSSIPWALDVARQFGVFGASFFTQSCLVSLIFYQVYEGVLRVPIEGPWRGVFTNDTPLLIEAREMPSFVYEVGLYPALEKLVINQFTNYGQADWRFFNTFDHLECEVINWMQSICTVKTIGPCIPSKYLDNRIPDDNDYGLSLFQPETDACIQWLDARQSGSVVYISMGSMASLGDKQMEEIARALLKSNKFFLWVVRASEENKIPPNFKEETSEKGLIVNWCPQLEVLSHPALGCFVTHCGWNSILEAISLGVPMVAFPQWTDQPTNAKCVTDLWKIGVKVRKNEGGLVTREEIELCILEVMEGDKSNEIKSNAKKWKNLAKETMEKGGSTSRNIEEFVAKLQN